MFETDPNGREVELTQARWEHIVERHPEMAPLRHAVLQAIREPSDIEYDARPSQDWFFLAEAGPSAWLQVVVAFDEKRRGTIRTAFPRRTRA